MAFIGAQPTTAAFPFDQFSGNGSTTAFTLTYAPASASSILVAVSGVVQNPNTYAVVSTTLTFSGAPPTGTNNISVLYLGLPVIGVSSPGNTAYFSSTSFTATASQTTFTPSGSYTPGFINVIRNGSQLAPADYTATNGTTVTLANACTAGDSVVIQVYTLTSISNALPLTGGTVTGASTFNAGVNLAVSSGNVGVGTSSPSAKLDVRGSSTYLVNATNPTAWVSVDSTLTTGSVYTQWNTTSSVGISGTYTNHAYTFVTNNNERARIDTSGNLLVGQTAQTSAEKFGVTQSSTSASSARFYASSTSYANDVVQISCARSGATTEYNALTVFDNNTTLKMLIRANGNLLNANNSYGSLSDQRIKENIVDATPKLEKLNQVRVVNFNMVGDAQKQIGVVAQELEQIFPGMIEEDRDGMKGVKYSVFVPMLIKAMQEQQAMIEELKAKVAALEAK